MQVLLQSSSFAPSPSLPIHLNSLPVMADNLKYRINSKVGTNEPYYLAIGAGNVVKGRTLRDSWQKVPIPGADNTQFALKHLDTSLYLAWESYKIILSQNTFAWVQIEENRGFPSTPTPYSIRPQPDQTLYLTFRNDIDDNVQLESKANNDVNDNPRDVQRWKFLRTY